MTARVILAVLVLLAVAGALWIRLAPEDAARWHVDPLTRADPATPNFARLAPGLVTGPAATLAAQADAAMRALPRTRRIAGDPASGMLTYVTRSALLGYPDYTTLRVLPGADAEAATLVAFAGARFGRSDFGVNAARLAALRAALARP